MQYPLAGIFQNRLLLVSLVSWFVAQALKIPFHKLLYGVWDLKRFFGSGGLPSSHSALVTSLAVSCGIIYGFDTPVFAVALIFAFIVMYDAAGVRRAAGKQAQTLNQLLNHIAQSAQPLSFEPEKLRELIGHTPFEVFAGALLGVVLAVLLCL